MLQPDICAISGASIITADGEKCSLNEKKDHDKELIEYHRMSEAVDNADEPFQIFVE